MAAAAPTSAAAAPSPVSSCVGGGGVARLLLRSPARLPFASAATAARPRGRPPATALRAARAAPDLVEQSVNTIRFLAVDAVEKAQSGHPGLPMGCAPLGHVLFDEFLRFNPKNPAWFDRDRFVLSAGHGCMLQYALLHLAGYDSVTMDDLKAFRQWRSRTPGHPENFETPGVEVTTGPLGQGFANAVGLALAEKHLAARFNKTDLEINGNTGYDDIRAAIKEAKGTKDKPTLIKVTTTIGFGSPNKANTYKVHGSALGSKEVEATRSNLRWLHKPFHVPDEVKRHWSHHIAEGAALEAEWNAKFAEYEKKYCQEAAELKSIISGELPSGWDNALTTYSPESPPDATRNLSQQCLNSLAIVLPGFIGGSADLASSNMTLLKMFGDFQRDSPEGRNIRFGVREHGMGAISNGIAVHSPGLIPYCATFFVFTDYMRAAIRLSALSDSRVIFVMTHDSIGLGEDGPTHQPVEQLFSLRAMPNTLMLRPADGNETSGAYKVAVLNSKRPSILALSRQKLPQLKGTSVDAVSKGGYTISDNSSGNKPDLILIATGSEVEIAEKAADELRKDGRTVRVVSLVCWELFEEQPEKYKESVLPSEVTSRISIEAGVTFGWEKYVGQKGRAIGIDRFGASAPAGKLYQELGLTVENVIAVAKTL
nr:unnamed protein product [Digitaria exilis]